MKRINYNIYNIGAGIAQNNDNNNLYIDAEFNEAGRITSIKSVSDGKNNLIDGGSDVDIELLEYIGTAGKITNYQAGVLSVAGFCVKFNGKTYLFPNSQAYIELNGGRWADSLLGGESLPEEDVDEFVAFTNQPENKTKFISSALEMFPYLKEWLPTDAVIPDVANPAQSGHIAFIEPTVIDEKGIERKLSDFLSNYLYEDFGSKAYKSGILVIEQGGDTQYAPIEETEFWIGIKDTIEFREFGVAYVEVSGEK